MSFQDTSSRWREINSPIPLLGGKFSGRGETYGPIRREGEYTFEPIIQKLKFPLFPHSKTDLRCWFFTHLFVCTVYTIGMLVVWYFPPIPTLVPAASYMLMPFMFVGWSGWWVGRRRNRKDITSLRDFAGTKEEWIGNLKRELKLFLKNRGDGANAIRYALGLTGKQERVLGMRNEEISCASMAWFVVLFCFQSGGEIARFGREWENFTGYVVMGCCAIMPSSMIIGGLCGSMREFDERVAEIRKNCELSTDEEKAEKELTVDLEWLVEHLLIFERDCEERAQEGREVIIDPILKAIR